MKCSAQQKRACLAGKSALRAVGRWVRTVFAVRLEEAGPRPPCPPEAQGPTHSQSQPHPCLLGLFSSDPKQMTTPGKGEGDWERELTFRSRCECSDVLERTIELTQFAVKKLRFREEFRRSPGSGLEGRE